MVSFAVVSESGMCHFVVVDGQVRAGGEASRDRGEKEISFRRFRSITTPVDGDHGFPRTIFKLAITRDVRRVGRKPCNFSTNTPMTVFGPH
jgi:hypothetical protein